MRNKKHLGVVKLLLVFLTLLIASAYSYGQERKITGTVTDKSGPIAGANIVVKGTTTGAITDLNGQYSINVPNEEAQITISFVGYVPQTFAVQGQSIVNAILVEDIASLSEVVVIGYGTQKKSDLTGAVSSVSADELNQTAVLGIDQALQGRAAGVQITSNSGSPGSPITVRIRGTGTVYNSDPLYVVDGIAGINPTSINPADIATIEVLKDAGAAGIYGAAAANGVVLITTRKGKSGAVVVEFNMYAGVQNPIKMYDVCDANQNAMLQVESWRNSKGVGGGAFWDTSTDTTKVFTNSTDWQDAIYQSGKIQNYHLGVSGGNEKTIYNFSLGYFDQEGIIKKSGINRTTARLNLSSKITDKITFGANINFANTNREVMDEASEWGPITFATMMYPNDSIYTDIPGYTWGSSSNNARNPVALSDNLFDNSENNQLTNILFVEAEILKGLKFKSIFGADYSYFNEKIFKASYEMVSADQGFPVSEIKEYYRRNESYSSENFLTYDFKLGEKNKFTLLADYTVSDAKYYWSNQNGKNTTNNSEEMRVIDATPVETRSASGSKGESKSTSLLGRMIYSFNDKYLLTASVRRDGSSKFGSENRYGVFPSVTTGWIISNEEFMKNISFISTLKIRAGWGIIGNNLIDDYAYAVPISETDRTMTYVFNDAVYNGAAPTSTSNPEVGWEESVQKNIAMDISFFNNSLSLTADYFYKTTNGMLLRKGVPAIVGLVENPYINAGNIENKGLELELTHKRTFNDFSYQIGLNGTFMKNTVLDIGDDPIYGTSIGGGVASKTVAGEPVFSFYGYKAEGIFQSYDEINKHAYQATKTAPGDVKYKDINGDGKINDDDQSFIGSPHPDLMYGLNMSAQYKGFDLNIFFQGTYGNDIYNYLKWSTVQYGFNYNTEMLNRWTPENPSATIPRVVSSDINNNRKFSSRFVEDGSYFRLKNIQLGYTLPEKISKVVKMQRCRVYISGDNLLTFTKYTGLDPEIGKTNRDYFGTERYELGFDRGNYPQAKKVMIGLNVTF